MQQYFNNSLMSKFIKNLLKNTYLPICGTVNKGSFLIENFVYVYETNLIRCTKTGYLGGILNQEVEYDSNGNITELEESIGQVASYAVISSYDFGKNYIKYTENYISNSNYYDIETHEHLGKYLRALRDVKGLDLMPYYNLYSDNYITNFRITEEGFEEYYTNTYKILKVPIKFNTVYTIALDCSSEVWICPAFFSKEIPLVFRDRVDSEKDVIMTDKLHEYIPMSIKNYTSLSYTSPITYSVENTSMGSVYADLDCAYFQQYEKNLCLLIQLPSSNNSAITILEGDYTNTEGSKIVNNEELWRLHDFELNKVFCSNLSLLQFDAKVNFVYSDRLIEYLLWNVVCTQDDINENISTIQGLIPGGLKYRYTIGVWNNILRSVLYRYSMDVKQSKRLDLNGFVDKDTESLLLNQIFNGYSW